jgi:hypothetical protein
MQKLVRATHTTSKVPASLKVFRDNAQKDTEVWHNDTYSVFVRRGIEVPEMNTTMCHISFHRHDRRAVTDWRHMQWMKNQLVGEENEGCEIFPAESRLVDGANEYHMWVFEDTKFNFPWGFHVRIVSDTSLLGETQRKWPTLRKPKDLNAMNDQLMEVVNKMNDEKED